MLNRRDGTRIPRNFPILGHFWGRGKGGPEPIPYLHLFFTLRCQSRGAPDILIHSRLLDKCDTLIIFYTLSLRFFPFKTHLESLLYARNLSFIGVGSLGRSRRLISHFLFQWSSKSRRKSPFLIRFLFFFFHLLLLLLLFVNGLNFQFNFIQRKTEGEAGGGLMGPINPRSRKKQTGKG